MLAVADVLESMTSHRPYRAALGLKAALKELQNKAGKLYDPDVVSVVIHFTKGGALELDAL